MTLTDEDIQQQGQKLPEEQRDFLFSGDFSDRVIKTANKHEIKKSLDIYTLSKIFSELIIKTIPKNRLRIEIQQQLKISEGKAMNIADALQKKPFKIEEKSNIPPNETPLPKIEIKPGALKPTPPPKPTPIPKRKTPEEAPSLKSLANAMSSKSSSGNKRPGIPLPEDALLKKQSQNKLQPASPTSLSIKPPSPTEKTLDSYREPVEPSDKTLNQPAPTPMPKRPKENRENLGPLIDGNIIDLRE